MAKGTFLPAVDDIEDVDLDFGQTQTETTNADNKADALVSALREDSTAYVNVLRQLSGGNSPMQFVERIPADKFDHGQLLTYLGSTYGGGEYRLMVYARGKLRANKLESIASKLMPEKHHNSPTGEAASILATVLDRIEASNRQMLEVLTRQTQAPDRTAMIQEMLMFKQLFSDNKPSGGLGQIQESITLLKELGIQVGGKSDDDDGESFTALLGKVAPLIVQAAQQPAQQPRPQQPQQPARTPEMLLTFKIKAGLQPFLKAAAKNADHGVYAEMLLDQLPHEIIASHILPDDSLEKLIKIEPQVANFRPWFELLKEHVKAQLEIPSKVDHLYDDLNSDITPDNNNDGGFIDGDNLHPASDQ